MTAGTGRILVVATTAALLGLLPMAGPALAAGIVVNSLDDSATTDANCTLREAITAANADAAVDGCAAGSGADTITFGVNGKISLGSVLPTIESSITLDGTSASITIADAPRGAGGPADGSAIFVDTGAFLTVKALTFSNNQSSLRGGAINNWGTLAVEQSSFDHNSSPLGGAIFSHFALVVRDSTFDHNFAPGNSLTHLPSSGGAIDSEAGTFSIARSTFVSNTAWADGGALIFSGQGDVVNSTFVGNGFSFTHHGGAIANAGGQVFLRWSTLARNQSQDGADLWAEQNTDSTAYTFVSTTILADALAGLDCAGTPITDSGYNVIEDGSCLTDATSQSGDPGLAPLADNGGYTETLSIYSGIAVDTVPYDHFSCVTGWSDQRGTARPQGGSCDVGAFEFHDTDAPVAAITTSPVSPDGLNGWFVSDPTATAGATDGGGSGLDEVRCVLDPTTPPSAFDDFDAGCDYASGLAVDTEGEHVLYVAAIDKHDNVSTVVSRDINVDTVDPQVACAGTAPTFELGAVTATVSADVTDDTSGPASATATAAANTASVGSKSASITGADVAGNTAGISCPYLVRYHFLGFTAPGTSTYSAGSTVIVRLKLGNVTGQPITDAEGSALASACGVKVALDGIGTARCATYDALHDEFRGLVSLPRSLTTGPYGIVARVLAGVTELNVETTTVSVRGTGRRL